MVIKQIAGNVLDILKLGGVSNLAVAGADAVAYSESFLLPEGQPSFALEYKATTGGVVALKIELEQGNQIPTTEGLADNNWVVPDDAGEINNNLTNQLTHIRSYTPAPTALARVKITGLTGNDASTVISKLKMYILK